MYECHETRHGVYSILYPRKNVKAQQTKAPAMNDGCVTLVSVFCAACLNFRSPSSNYYAAYQAFQKSPV